MKLFAAITKLDAEQRLVFGYASTEALDSQNEIVRRDALEAALPSYLKFANLREMHQPSAVGIAHQAEVDEKGLYIAAKVVDPLAWEKVKAGVYKGFSIGGTALARDPVNKHVITKLELTEISLVDRPANPEAVIDLFKRGESVTDWRATLMTAVEAALAQDNATLGPDLLEALQNVQDCLSGVTPGEDEGEDEDEPEDRIAGAATIGSLQKFETSIAAMGRECRRLSEEIDRLAATPHPAKGVLRVIGKGEDGVAKATEPMDALAAIKQAHQRPMRVF